MGLFERGYRAAAKTELERDIREIEEKDKKAQTRQEFDGAIEILNNNVNFAERLNLISEEQADNYRERIKKAYIEQEWQQDRELENMVDERYLSMAEAQSQISQERENAMEHSYPNQSEQTHTVSVKSTEEVERTK